MHQAIEMYVAKSWSKFTNAVYVMKYNNNQLSAFQKLVELSTKNSTSTP